MNIGFFTELFPPSVGGQQQRFAELANLLAMQGHQVTVMCIRDLVDSPAQEKLANGVKFVCTIPNARNPAKIRTYEATAATDLAAIRAVLEQIEKEQ